MILTPAKQRIEQNKQNGAILFGDTKLLVVNDKDERALIAVEKYNDACKKQNYYSYYKGMKSKFYVVQYPGLSSFEYEILLNNGKSMICGQKHKSMVYCDNDLIKSSELLPIEYIYEKYQEKERKNIYIPYKDISNEKSAVDLSYVLINSVSLNKNAKNRPVYVIVFTSKPASVLLMLENGIIIKGDKESDLIINVENKITA
jgi:hypothetical protein